MKCSELWLREWVNPNLTRDQLAMSLTMAGFEVEEMIPVAKELSGIVVGKVLKIEKHKEAKRLQVCEVDIGRETLQIVCGAPNVRVGMKAPVALVNAILPNQTVITSSNIRGVISNGMLCSASELGLAEESEGLLELSDDAPIGNDLNTFLKLDDYIIDIAITPNRGDCLSVVGLAREISAITQSPQLKDDVSSEIKPTSKTLIPVSIQDKSGCPCYVGRVIQKVKADAMTPTWMKERLRRSGVRSISPIVDVTNYVMLELGQPMHAFDLASIQDEIIIRKSREGEKIALLDGSEKELDDETLVIADKEKALALAGVMGGIDSSVTTLTSDIFLESAFFMPQVVAKQRQYYNLNSESAYRFERGVDPTIQKRAMERATELILQIAGGKAGPLIEVISKDDLPKQNKIALTPEKIKQVLGIAINDNEVETILHALKFQFQKENHRWEISVPSFRFDIAFPEDVIEEIARLYGYDKIPSLPLKADLHTPYADHEARDLAYLRNKLSDLGYHEIISYSFVDDTLQKMLDPHQIAFELVNPITSDMNVMRTTLWPGLINALVYNKSRQQHHIRLFEIGSCFIKKEGELRQLSMLGGLISGSSSPEQWGVATRPADFFDLKGDLEHLLFPLLDHLNFKPEKMPSLHPGQSAGMYYKNQKIGILGALHPQILQTLDLSEPVFVYELDISFLKETKLYLFQEISKFPEIRRDLAILVNHAIPAREIQDTIKVIAGDWLKDVFIFDVYQGKGISPGLKSIALGLILQHPTRTLVDDEVAALMERIVSTLKGKLGAELRR